MGAVYEVLDRERNARIALKTLHRIDGQAILLFKNEFRTVQDVEHDNLVHLGELFHEDDQWFFTMEYVEGSALLDFIWRRADSEQNDTIESQPTRMNTSDFASAPTQPGAVPRIYDEPRLRNAMAQLARGIATLHSAGHLHRDIKPANVRVDREGRVVLLDFGLATSAMSAPTTTETLVGTAAYMAPELAFGGGERAADWYSFGVILYEALTGTLPHTGATTVELLMNRQTIDAPAPGSITDVPEDLEALCMALLARPPRERPNVEQILAALNPADGVIQETRAVYRSQPVSAFVGRERELLALREAFDDSQRGQAIALHVRGPSGVGKSELVRHFAATIASERPDLVTLRGRCYQRASVPFKAFDGVVDALSRFLSELPDQTVAELLPARPAALAHSFPVLRRIRGFADALTDAPRISEASYERGRTFDAFRELLRKMAERFPVVIVIDDFQWTDADSVVLLEELLQHAGAPPLLLLITERDHGRARTRAGIEVGARNDTRLVRVEGLSDERVRELIAMLAPTLASDHPELVDAIVRESAGHPMFVQELVRHAEHEEDAALSLDEALWKRLQRLPVAEQDLVELLSVADTPVTVETALNAMSLDFDGFERMLARLCIESLVRRSGHSKSGIEPYHDRVREAVIAHLSDEQRMRHHRRLVTALEQTGAGDRQPQVLVRHLIAVGATERAAELAAQAADQAMAMLAFERAAELFRIAIDLGDHSEDERRQLSMRLGEALVDGGLGTEAAEVFLKAAGGADPATRLDCHRQAAEQLLISGQVDEGLATTKLLLSELGLSLPKSPRRALISLLWHRMRVRIRGIRWKEKHEREIPDHTLMRIDAYKGIASGLGLVDTIRGADFQSRSVLLALRVGEPLRVGRAVGVEAVLTATQGRKSLPRATRLCDELEKIAHRTGDAFLNALLIGIRGIVAFYGEHLDDACRNLAEAEGRVKRIAGTAFESHSLRMFQMLALRQRGSLRELATVYESAVRDATRRGDRHNETTYRRIALQVWLARDDTAEAHRELERATWVPPKGRFHLQHWYELESRGELAIYEGRAEDVCADLEAQLAELDRALLNRVQRIRVAGLWLRGRLTAALRSRDSGPVARRCARALGREKIGSASVYASLLMCVVHAMSGNLDALRGALTEAENSAAENNMGSQRATAAYFLGHLGDNSAALRASTWFDREHVKAPARFAEMNLPIGETLRRQLTSKQ